MQLRMTIEVKACGLRLHHETLGSSREQPRGRDALFAVVVDFAVAIILFEGALDLKIRRLRREERAIRGLVTRGESSSS